jgi:hypothetical protein
MPIFAVESVWKIFGKSNGFAAGYGKSISKRIHLPPYADEGVLRLLECLFHITFNY